MFALFEMTTVLRCFAIFIRLFLCKCLQKIAWHGLEYLFSMEMLHCDVMLFILCTAVMVFSKFNFMINDSVDISISRDNVTVLSRRSFMMDFAYGWCLAHLSRNWMAAYLRSASLLRTLPLCMVVFLVFMHGCCFYAWLLTRRAQAHFAVSLHCC